MKKFFLMLLCGVLMLSVFACSEPKKTDPEEAPDWEALLFEYDEWATEYVNFLIAYKKDPTNPVTSAMVGRWPSEIAEWKEQTDAMFAALKDFPTERNAYIKELSRITKRLTDAAGDTVTEAEINTFLSEYNKWADKYVAFFAAHKDDKKSPEYQTGLTELMTESTEWIGKVKTMTERIIDPTLRASFSAETAKIAAKIASANN